MKKTEHASAYEQAEAYIYNIPKFTTKNGLEHTRFVLKELGNPGMHKKIIHVAGTNGKGSVCAFLNQLLRHANKSVGMFTSPHLVSMCERVLVNGDMISENIFIEAYECVLQKIKELKSQDENFSHPTFFEFLFLMAMVVFEKSEVEYIILETGLGGRKDATNVVNPVMTIITEIGLDHCQYLGDTKEKIAWEKAGIIKKQVPIVYLKEKEPAATVIEQRAQEKQAILCPLTQKNYHVEKSNHKKVAFSFHSRYYSYVGFIISTPALYQVENAALALTAFESMMEKEEITTDKMQQAIADTHWEGRMEEVMPHIFVDGAHNPDGIAAFLEAVKGHDFSGRKHLLFSVVGDKAYQEMIDMLMQSGLFCDVVLTGMKEERAVEVEKLQKIFSKYTQDNLQVTDNVKEALSVARTHLEREDVLYIVGSLYLVGFVKKALQEMH